MSLVCVQYSSGICGAIVMSPYKVMFGVDAFAFWADLDVKEAGSDLQNLAQQLFLQHKVPVLSSIRSRTKVAKHFGKGIFKTT